MGGLTKSRTNTTFSSKLWLRELFSNDVRNSETERMLINIPKQDSSGKSNIVGLFTRAKREILCACHFFHFFNVVIWGFLRVNFPDVWRRLISGSRCFPLFKSFPLLAKIEWPTKTLLKRYLFCRWYETLRTILDIIDETFKSPPPPPSKKTSRKEGSCAFGAPSSGLIHYFGGEKGDLLLLQIPLQLVRHMFDWSVCRAFGITHDHLISDKFQKGAFSEGEFCDIVRSSLVGILKISLSFPIPTPVWNH